MHEGYWANNLMDDDPRQEEITVIRALRVKHEAENRIYERIGFGTNVLTKLWLILIGLVGAVLWVGRLQWQVSSNQAYIEKEQVDHISERLHDAESAGGRRDRQIDKLNNKVFNYEP